MPRSFTTTSNNCLRGAMKNSIQCNEREAISPRESVSFYYLKQMSKKYIEDVFGGVL